MPGLIKHRNLRREDESPVGKECRLIVIPRMPGDVHQIRDRETIPGHIQRPNPDLGIIDLGGEGCCKGEKEKREDDLPHGQIVSRTRMREWLLNLALRLHCTVATTLRSSFPVSAMKWSWRSPRT